MSCPSAFSNRANRSVLGPTAPMSSRPSRSRVTMRYRLVALKLPHPLLGSEPSPRLSHRALPGSTAAVGARSRPVAPPNWREIAKQSGNLLCEAFLSALGEHEERLDLVLCPLVSPFREQLAHDKAGWSQSPASSREHRRSKTMTLTLIAVLGWYWSHAQPEIARQLACSTYPS